MFNTAIINALKSGDLTKIREWIEQVGDINEEIQHGLAAIHYASMLGHLNATRELVKSGADVNLRISISSEIESGKCPLHLAAENGHAEVVDFLIKSGASVNDGCFLDGNNTALHLSVINNHITSIECLIKHGADLDLTDANGKNAMSYAISFGDAKIIETLLNAGASVPPQKNRRIRQHEWKQESGAISMGPMITKKTPSLHAAAEKGMADVVRRIISSGASVDAEDDCGATALYCASSNGHLAAAEILINTGADVDFKNTWTGWTPLLHASYEGHTAVVELLMRFRADIDATDYNGKTALHLALENNHPSCVVALINAGADINSLDKEGRSPLSLATKLSLTEVHPRLAAAR